MSGDKSEKSYHEIGQEWKFGDGSGGGGDATTASVENIGACLSTALGILASWLVQAIPHVMEEDNAKLLVMYVKHLEQQQ